MTDWAALRVPDSDRADTANCELADLL